MKRQYLAVLFSLLFAAGALAQQKKEETPRPAEARVSKVIPIKHLSGRDLDRAMQLMRNLGVNVDGDAALRLVTVNGPAQSVTVVENAMKVLDTPASGPPTNRNIEVVLHVVLGSPQSGDSTLPADLDPVIKQMRSLFQFQSYRVLDTQVIRTRDSGQGRTEMARFSGHVANPGRGGYRCVGQFHAAMSEDSRGRSFRLDNFDYGCGDAVRIRTDVDIRDGQKAVVGKSNLDAESSIFVVVSAKLVE